MKPGRFCSIIAVIATACILLSPPAGTKASGSESVRVVFDFRINDIEAAELMLASILETRMHYQEEGRKADFVVIFMGTSVEIIASGEQKIERAISRMNQAGIRLKGDLSAAYFAGVEPSAFPLEIQEVENGMVSLIDYQEKSYSLVPVY